MARGREPNVKQVVADLRSLFRGVVKQHDPGALLAGELQDAQNARLVNGNLISRGGQSKVNGVGTTPATVTGAPLAIFDDWQGSIPNYPVYGGFQGYTLWAGDTEPNYYQAFYDFSGLSLTVTTIPRDSSLIPASFHILPVQPVKVGDYWYSIARQQAGVNYSGTGFALWWMIVRGSPGTSFVEYDTYSPTRQLISSGQTVHFTFFNLTHDGDNFIVSLRAVDNSGSDIYDSTYKAHVLRLITDGSTEPEILGDLIDDINTTITSNGGTAIVAGSVSPGFGVVYHEGYILAYPANCSSAHLDAVGTSKPGYAAYISKAGSTWSLVNATASPVADGAIGRTRWYQVHDGKVYLLTATDHDLLGDCVMRVWDPATDPSVVSEVFTLSGGRRWLTFGAADENGGNAVSWRGKLYFSWTTGTEIGIGSWDGATLVEDVWSTAWVLNAVDAVWVMPLRTGLAVIVQDESYAPDRQKIWYSSGIDLATWSSVSVEGVEKNFRAMMPEEL